MITYLYHKRHRKTNLNYFGKTIRDPYTYIGSGVYWRNHLNKHGKDVETVQVWKFENLEDCSKFAVEFSVKNNIVESTDWANLCLEDGLAGGDKFSCMEPTKKADVDYRKSIAHLEIWKTRDRQTQANNTRNQWSNRDSSVSAEINTKISHTLLNKTPAQRAETCRKRHETESRRPLTVCPHCGKVSKGLSNMRRYHLDNCKSKIA